jgi:two-component system sensor histidine kinase BaeS
VRLLLTSVAIAVVSVGATAWLAVQTTTRAIQEERGQVLSDDTDILRRLSGFAATHADWDGVQSSVRDLSHTTGRRIALTTEAGRVIADSAAPGTALPARASATVDPLNTDTSTEPGAQLAGIDPRAVGPYRLPAAERARVKARSVWRACARTWATAASGSSPAAAPWSSPTAERQPCPRSARTERSTPPPAPSRRPWTNSSH